MGGISSREPGFLARHTRDNLDTGNSKIVKRKGSWFLVRVLPPKNDDGTPRLAYRDALPDGSILTVVKRHVRRRAGGETYVDFFDLAEGPCDTAGFPFEWLTTPGLALDGYAKATVEIAREKADQGAKMKALTALAAAGDRRRVIVERRPITNRREYVERYEGVVMDAPARGGFVLHVVAGPAFVGRAVRFTAEHGWRITGNPS